MSTERVRVGNYIIEPFDIAQTYHTSKREWFVDRIMGTNANGGFDLKTVRIFDTRHEAVEWAMRH